MDVDIDVDEGGFGGSWGGFGNKIRLSILGPDIETLQAISNKIETLVMQDSSVISVDNGRSDPTPELHFQVDRQRVSRLGTSLQQVASALKSQVQGTRVGFFRDEGREVPIQFRVSKDVVTSREKVGDLELASANNQRVPLAALGSLQSFEGLDRITRRDRETVLDVNISIDGNVMEYRGKIIDLIKANVVLPPGYRYQFTGGSRDTQESNQQMMFALLFAVALMYMIMGSLFENFKDPLIIWFTIPLALFGAYFGLFVTGTPLAATAYIGMFMLVGIIVNNGIVLVDYVHLYLKNKEVTPAEHETRESVLDNAIEACKRRLRPILLTALTTICSMIPLSFGFGSGGDIWAPLARSVIGGLFFGTLLTLYVVPAFVMGISKKRRQAINEERQPAN